MLYFWWGCRGMWNWSLLGVKGLIWLWASAGLTHGRFEVEQTLETPAIPSYHDVPSSWSTFSWQTLIYLCVDWLSRNYNRYCRCCRSWNLHHGDVENPKVQSPRWLVPGESGASKRAGQVAHGAGVLVRAADHVGTWPSRRPFGAGLL